MNYSIEYIIIDFRDTHAILHNDTESDIRWPIQKLPENIKKGDKITLKVANKDDEFEIRRKLLEEIVN